LIYAIGGYNDQNGYLRSAEVYNLDSETWKPLPDLANIRWALAGAVDSAGLIYALGGTDGDFNCWAVPEVYNPSTGLWSSLTSSPLLPPSSEGAATIGPDNTIYYMGGQTNCGGPTTNSTQRFTPKLQL